MIQLQLPQYEDIMRMCSKWEIIFIPCTCTRGKVHVISSVVCLPLSTQKSPDLEHEMYVSRQVANTVKMSEIAKKKTSLFFIVLKDHEHCKSRFLISHTY